MKNITVGVLFVMLFLFAGVKGMAQEITKYDYLEVIVIQKMNNSGKIKRVKVEDQKINISFHRLPESGDTFLSIGVEDDKKE